MLDGIVPLADAIHLKSFPHGGTPSGHHSAPVPPSISGSTELESGCYQLTYIPRSGPTSLQGTLRVDRATPTRGSDGVIISGDLYVKPPGFGAATTGRGEPTGTSRQISIFPRKTYF